jgi:DNA-directed RNA polymerase I, II, and III subunit RPABC2
MIVKSKKPAKTEEVSVGPKKITRFERAKVISARALQIAMGAPVLVKTPPDIDSPIDIAVLEIEEGILPISITRRLPDGTTQNIPLKLLLDK